VATSPDGNVSDNRVGDVRLEWLNISCLDFWRLDDVYCCRLSPDIPSILHAELMMLLVCTGNTKRRRDESENPNNNKSSKIAKMTTTTNKNTQKQARHKRGSSSLGFGRYISIFTSWCIRHFDILMVKMLIICFSS